MRKVITITVDTDCPTDKIRFALLDALYEARAARGNNYVDRNPAYAKLTPEERAAKVASNDEKRAFYQDTHDGVMTGMNIEDVPDCT